MTEAEWQTTTEIYHLARPHKCRSERKRRLLSCAFAWRVIHLIPDERYKTALETAEKFADGAATEADMKACRRLMKHLFEPYLNKFSPEAAAATTIILTLEQKVSSALQSFEKAQWARGELSRPDFEKGCREEEKFQCILARDVYGNPFRPVSAQPSWLTSTVLALASGIYEEKAFDRMPILADALQDAGCDNEDILNHCRQPSEHVRGCFVVDLLLAKQ
jgi:hypothetical protein